ncbi:hypothetical protein [Virgisporangium ochraceum]|uniref:Uncharacterized protein n=1 Tax=Virgisporangium ochraceum TaxID=65505 RepID=A0A8J4A2E4_9ACTN|nr:hypothetical protein [Virgisporangium ochraceum]GIJ71541.1 hypothetical protein Voc01_064580 [Virgisporangium ochraceum]
MTVDISAALRPLREALLEQAGADARSRIADAEADAVRTLDAAKREADGIRTAARRDGEADARALQTADLARARRQARASVLAAQRSGYEALRACVADTLRTGAAAEELRNALVARVRAVLGPEARTVDHPSGGVVGEVPGRRVDCSVDALVDRVLSAESGVAAGLWSP